MPFPPGEIVSIGVEWEQTFWDATEALYPEITDTDSNELVSTLPDDHSSVKDAMQCRSHPSKGKRRRNRKDKEWLAIDRIVKARKAAGKESHVYLDKQLVDPRKLQKNTSRPRFMQPFEKYGNIPLPPVPRDFEIRTPPWQDSIPAWTQELPFMQFRDLFQQDVTPHIYTSATSNRSPDSALNQIVLTMHSQIVIPKLEALLPSPMFRAYTTGSPKTGLKVERASGAYLDLLNFSITNNFTGLDDLPPHRALDYLKSHFTTHSTLLMHSIGGQTGRALAEKLFVCAIEAKDTSIVEFILRHSQNTKVDANKSICKYDGHRYTPLERSAGLRDIETIRILFKYGADPNKTYAANRTHFGIEPGWREGALSCAIDWDILVKSPVEFELVQLLLEHNAYVKARHLETAIQQQRSEVVHALFQAGVLENHQQWGDSGLFVQVIGVLDDEAATESIKMLKEIGADINASQDRQCPTMLATAAKRGNLDMVLMLLHFGAIETEATLLYAIQGKNRAIFDLFLDGGNADCLSHDSLQTTPYAEAIRIKDERLMQALEQRGCLSNITEENRLWAALMAALEVRNLEVIRYLLHTGIGKMNRMADDALRIAAKANDEELVTMFCHSGMRSLYGIGEAMRNRNPRIVRAFLDFDAYRYSPEGLRGPPVLALAVIWGDMSVIEDLLIAGYDINGYDSTIITPLIAATSKKDQQLVQLLVNAGADVDKTVSNSTNEPSTALSTAIGIQDIDMVNYLLSVDADPGDPVALLKSCENGGEILGVLLEAFLKRYPNGKKGCFDDSLAHAVRKNDIYMLESLRPMITLKYPGYSQHVSALIGTRLIASNEVSLEAVRMLLDSGANPDAVIWSRERNERIPLLSAAVQAKNVQMVQLLLDKGAKINFPAIRGIKFTPIQMAAKMGYYETVLTLINRGANVDAPAADARGGTAIQMAAIGGFIGIVDLLLKKGANINRAPSIVHGRTALEGAAEHGRLDMVQFLLQSGTQIDGGGHKSFLNAMKLAEENGHFVVLELLQSYSQ